MFESFVILTFISPSVSPGVNPLLPLCRVNGRPLLLPLVNVGGEADAGAPDDESPIASPVLQRRGSPAPSASGSNAYYLSA